MWKAVCIITPFNDPGEAPSIPICKGEGRVQQGSAGFESRAGSSSGLEFWAQWCPSLRWPALPVGKRPLSLFPSARRGTSLSSLGVHWEPGCPRGRPQSSMLPASKIHSRKKPPGTRLVSDLFPPPPQASPAFSGPHLLSSPAGFLCGTPCRQVGLAGGQMWLPHLTSPSTLGTRQVLPGWVVHVLRAQIFSSLMFGTHRVIVGYKLCMKLLLFLS